MISLTVDLAPDAATPVKLSRSTILKAGGDIPVRILFTSAPGDLTEIQFALGSDAEVSTVLAFTDDFTEENATLWTATLDGTDTRLATALATKGSINAKGELVTTIGGKREVWPNVAIPVQRPVINGPEGSEGGPVLGHVRRSAGVLIASVAGQPAAMTITVAAGIGGGSWTITTNGAPVTITFGSPFDDPAPDVQVYESEGGNLNTDDIAIALAAVLGGIASGSSVDLATAEVGESATIVAGAFLNLSFSPSASVAGVDGVAGVSAHTHAPAVTGKTHQLLAQGVTITGENAWENNIVLGYQDGEEFLVAALIAPVAPGVAAFTTLFAPYFAPPAGRALRSLVWSTEPADETTGSPATVTAVFATIS